MRLLPYSNTCHPFRVLIRVLVTLLFDSTQLTLEFDMETFRPTPESVPPKDVSYRLRLPHGVPVYKHPLVRTL